MQRILIIAVSLWTLSSAAIAGPPSIFNWSGFYVGGFGSYGFGYTELCQVGLSPCPYTPTSINHDKDHGWMGGALVGYNFQSNNWVLGVEGDWSAGHLKADNIPSGSSFNCGVGASNKCTFDFDRVFTLRARAGYAFGNLLPYMTAGLAYNHLEAGTNGGSTFSTSETKATFVWGGGVEYAFAPNWSAKIEYLRTGPMPDVTFDAALGACGTVQPCYFHDAHLNMVRLGLNYRFGGSQ